MSSTFVHSLANLRDDSSVLTSSALLSGGACVSSFGVSSSAGATDGSSRFASLTSGVSLSCGSGRDSSSSYSLDDSDF